MYWIVVGAEPEGLHLIDCVISDGNEVTLIEPDREKARKAIQNHDIKVLHSNISSESILDEADTERDDVLAATSLDDATNLMTMMLGREYGIQSLITIARQKCHQPLFEKLGAKVMANPAVVVARQLYEMVET